MRRTAAAWSLLTLLGAGWTGSRHFAGPVEAAQVSASGGSIWAGVSTDAQVKRGAAAYQRECAACHGTKLQAGDPQAPPLTGPPFRFQWQGKTIAEKFEQIRATMPMPADRAGTLDAQAYIDIVAFILHFNGYPTGSQELEPKVDLLKEIAIAPKP